MFAKQILIITSIQFEICLFQFWKWHLRYDCLAQHITEKKWKESGV